MSALDLAALPEGSAVVVEGLSGLVGRQRRGPVDELERLCAEISRPERGRFRVLMSVSGEVRGVAS